MKLFKNPPFEIDPNDPFKSDEFRRKPAIELMTKLVQSTDQPFVISVEAPWGWGKTKFIEMWKAHLEKSGHICLHFNAWENDFISDPLVAFVGEMKALVRCKSATSETPIQQEWEKLCRIGGTLVKKSAPIVIKAAASKALGSEAMKEFSDIVAESGDEIADALSKAAEKQIERYEEEKNSIVKFRKTLCELAKNVTEGDGNAKQVVFFVDELDRCRPDFAITLLERIKHLFNVPQMIFVLSMDREQLTNTVRLLYGSGDRADSYLRRFVDLSYKLPPPARGSVTQMLLSRFQMVELFRRRVHGGTEYNRFTNAFEGVTKWLNLDLRTQEQCFTRINIVARLWEADEYLPIDALCILVALRIGETEKFELLRTGKVKPLSIIAKPPTNGDEFDAMLEATLCTMFYTEDQLAKEKIELDKEVIGAAPARPNAARIQKLFEHLSYHKAQFHRLLEFSTEFH